jgi:hypothetical protein
MDDRAGCKSFVDRLVGRAQPTGMSDGDHAAACNDSREGHDAVACAENRLAHGRQQVDAAVPCRPLGPRRLESAKEHWLRG